MQGACREERRTRKGRFALQCKTATTRRERVVSRRSIFKHAGNCAGSPVGKPDESMLRMQHINPYAKGIVWDGIQHGGPPWRGFCITGLAIGTHYFPRRGRVIAVSGVFGKVGNRPGMRPGVCRSPVRYRCRLMQNGRVLPFWWLACDDPAHREGAGVLEHLDENGWVVEVEHVGDIAELSLMEEAALPLFVPLSAPPTDPPPLPPGPMLAPAPKGGSRRGWGRSR